VVIGRVFDRNHLPLNVLEQLNSRLAMPSVFTIRDLGEDTVCGGAMESVSMPVDAAQGRVFRIKRRFGSHYPVFVVKTVVNWIVVSITRSINEWSMHTVTRLRQHSFM